MKEYTLGNSSLQSSRLIYGCMRITGDNSPQDREKGKSAIMAALDAGYNHFDHADIYARGESEVLFGEVLAQDPTIRQNILITSKCGIRFKDEPLQGDPQRYDFSYQYILDSVEGSLKRLGIETLDTLLLHRPDYLYQPEEVARAFSRLLDQNKVRYFGVSNFSASQFSVLQSYCDMQLIVNQIEVNIHNISSLGDGTLDQCMERQISPQAWCPLGGIVYPAWGNTLSPEREAAIKYEVEKQSQKYNADASQIALAWILKHPSQIFPLVGSTNPQRIRSAVESLDIEYSREDWYRLLEARRGHPVA